MDHQGAQIAIAAFADAKQLSSTPTRPLLGDKPQPRGELAAILEARSISYRGNQRRCCHGSNTFDFPEALADLAVAIELTDLPIIKCDLTIQLDQFHLYFPNERYGPGR